MSSGHPTGLESMATIATTMKVPGATLYYEVRGSGPTLLMIPGGPADAGGFETLAQALADRYTVVTCDPRGNSRSTFDGAPEDLRVDVHADDARRLLAAVGDGPAYVLGHSGGGVVALELATAHPDAVHTLVVHEPPVVELLPDREQQRAAGQDVYDTYRTQGLGAAMQKFTANAGLDEGPNGSAPPPEMAEAMARMAANAEYFVAHGMRALTAYEPDVPTLRAGRPRIVVGVGEASSERQVARRAAEALAERLGTKPVRFRGDHNISAHPAAFAETLDDVLRNNGG